MKAATTLLCKGVSSGFFFRHYGNGARNLTFKDMDVVYENSDFTGDIVESLTSPGLTLERTRLGCYGGLLGTRVQTARSCIRPTFDEFLRCEDVVFDGAQNGFWSDGARTIPGLSFGGWGTTLINCTFYDLANSMIHHAANRGRSIVNVIGCAFNPINISPARCFDITNIEGINVTGNQFTPSTGSQPTQEWIRLLGSTGAIDGNTFSGPSSKLGTIGGV
ncbi:hypothetical protein ACX6VM_004940, partial [Enterobacter hormaechei]